MEYITDTWRCQSCGKIFVGRDNAIKHDIECNRNPFNKHCFTCKNYKHKSFVYYIDDIKEEFMCNELKMDNPERSHCNMWEEK